MEARGPDTDGARARATAGGMIGDGGSEDKGLLRGESSLSKSSDEFDAVRTTRFSSERGLLRCDNGAPGSPVPFDDDAPAVIMS